MYLPLDHRFRRTGRGHCVRVTVHDLPGVLLGTEDHRDPKGKRYDLVPLADLSPGVLYPHDVGELRGVAPDHGLEGIDLALPEVRGGALHRLSDLIPPAGGRGDGIGEGHVLPVGEHGLHGFGISLDELAQRLLASFDYPVEVVYGSHLGITSITPAPFP